MSLKYHSYEEVSALLGFGSTKIKRIHLLLGNGFSIAYDQLFNYTRLFEFAKTNIFTPRMFGFFNRLGTNNFESVLRHLDECVASLSSYKADPKLIQEIQEDHTGIKKALIEAIAKTHSPKTTDVPPEKKECCVKFLQDYYNVFTTNYDTLLYWVEMHTESLRRNDGFGDDPEHQREYVLFREHIKDRKGILYLHGGLHLYCVLGQVRKRTWCRTGIPIITGVNNGIEQKEYPLFVAEGQSGKKLEQIQSSGYLSYCLSKLGRIKNELVTLGFSYGPSDQHIIDTLVLNPDLSNIYVGLFGNPDSSTNLTIRDTVAAMIERRNRLCVKHKRHFPKPLTTAYFETSTAGIWEPYSSPVPVPHAAS